MKNQQEVIDGILEVYTNIEKAYEGIVESGIIGECHKLIVSAKRSQLVPLAVELLENAAYIYSKRSERPPSGESPKLLHRYLTPMSASSLFNRRELELINRENSSFKAAFDDISDWLYYGEKLTNNKRSALRSAFFTIESSIIEIHDYFTEIVEAIEDGEIVAEEE